VSRLGEELKDPWGPLLGVLAGGMAGVGLGLAAPVAVGIGAAVYGVKVAVGALTGGTPEPDKELARPRYGTPAFTWLKRAEDASRQLDDMARRAGQSPTGDSARRSAEEARGILVDMRRLGGQAAAVMQAMSRVNSDGLDAEAEQLRRAASASPDDASAQQSWQAVQDRMAVRDRLQTAGQAQDGRLQASALGLEGLVARIAELVATADAVGQVDPTPADLAALSTELDGLRLGLADVEQVARKALGAAG
jgi:hypothetical protein